MCARFNLFSFVECLCFVVLSWKVAEFGANQSMLNKQSNYNACVCVCVCIENYFTTSNIFFARGSNQHRIPDGSLSFQLSIINLFNFLYACKLDIQTFFTRSCRFRAHTHTTPVVVLHKFISFDEWFWNQTISLVLQNIMANDVTWLKSQGIWTKSTKVNLKTPPRTYSNTFHFAIAQ